MTRGNNRVLHFCHSSDLENRRVPGDVVECTDYEDRSTPSRWDLEQIAWTLQSDRGGRVQGFAPPKRDRPI